MVKLRPMRSKDKLAKELIMLSCPLQKVFKNQMFLSLDTEGVNASIVATILSP
jgi:hypothetical protein